MGIEYLRIYHHSHARSAEHPANHRTIFKIFLFLLGALGIYGFMFLYLMGLSKTTPVSSSIFTSLQPIWVFVIAVVFFKEKISAMKIVRSPMLSIWWQVTEY